MSRPSRCPDCGSSSVYKERINGAQTGDWVCADCGKEGQLNGVPIGTVLPEHTQGEEKTE